jgi:hypothetical protein
MSNPYSFIAKYCSEKLVLLQSTELITPEFMENLINEAASKQKEITHETEQSIQIIEQNYQEMQKESQSIKRELLPDFDLKEAVFAVLDIHQNKLSKWTMKTLKHEIIEHFYLPLNALHKKNAEIQSYYQTFMTRHNFIEEGTKHYIQQYEKLSIPFNVHTIRYNMIRLYEKKIKEQEIKQQVSSPPEVKQLSDFKAKETEWSCSTCDVINPLSLTICRCCEAPNPKVQKEDKKIEDKKIEEIKEGDEDKAKMLSKYTVVKLHEICKEKKIKGYSKLKKQELITLLSSL